MKLTNNFSDLIMECKQGDLLFFRDDSFISRTIRRFDSEKKRVGWSHVEKVASQINTTWGTDIVSISAREINGGMVESALLSPMRWKDGLEILVRRPKSATLDQIRSSISYAMTKRGVKYDYRSVLVGKTLAFLGLKYKDDPKRYFCSEIIRDADKMAGIIKHREKNKEPDPSELSAYPEYEDVLLYQKDKK